MENLKKTNGDLVPIHSKKNKFPVSGYPGYRERCPTVKKLDQTYIKEYENTKNT